MPPGRRLELYCFYFYKQTYISIFLLYFSMAKVKSIPGVLYDEPSPPPRTNHLASTPWPEVLGVVYTTLTLALFGLASQRLDAGLRRH